VQLLCGGKSNSMTFHRRQGPQAQFYYATLTIVIPYQWSAGGTMMHVVEEITSRGADPSNIRIVCVVAAPPALSKLNAKYPGVVVYAGMLDAEVNERGYIVPGLGDAGDRAFGTPTRL
jgi:uracil phosphoribosyltransferase